MSLYAGRPVFPLCIQVHDSDALEGSGTDFGASHAAAGLELEPISSSASSEAAVEANKWAA